ncbi:MAG: hypothetical protein A3K46_00155 [Chloroflexi bacterium RBG_13_60_9]|nr:MAG: hypothetical protein A3K46_00155 [Chloroflexi bacterium RBG_13_60_9]
MERVGKCGFTLFPCSSKKVLVFPDPALPSSLSRRNARRRKRDTAGTTINKTRIGTALSSGAAETGLTVEHSVAADQPNRQAC